jgi:hypothetical protein
MWLSRRTSGVLAALLLGCAAVRADDVHGPAEPPDPGFLEFLGSVDRLADVNPEYLAQPEARSQAAAATTPPPPPPRPPPAPKAPNGPGGHNNE